MSQELSPNACPILLSLSVSVSNLNLSAFMITCKATSSLNNINTIQIQCLMFETIKVL